MGTGGAKEHLVTRRTLLSVVGAATLLLSAVAGGAPAANAAGNGSGSLHAKRVCAATSSATVASCASKVLVNGKGAVPASTTPAPSAKTPAQLKDAYKLTGTSSGGRTVAIVDAYGYPNLAADLATYRSYFGLPACTTASGCLSIMDQNGGTNLPRFNAGWAGEQALDVDAVSAICPDCKILVVAGQERLDRQPRDRRQHRLEAGRRRRDLQQLRRRRPVGRHLRRQLQPPRASR